MSLSVPSSIVSSPQRVATTPTPVTRSSSPYQISEGSVNRLCGHHPIVVSYGYTTAAWHQVGAALKTVKGDDGVWDYVLGSRDATHRSALGAQVIKIHVPDDDSSGSQFATFATRRQCKAGLINAVFHNYRSMKTCRDDFVPVIFNIDLSRMYDLRPINKSSRTTLCEIEIVRKLCTDVRLPAAFREMARKTVKFVHVQELTYRKPGLLGRERTMVHKYYLTEVGAPWEDAGYAEHRRNVKEKFLAAHPNFIPPASKFDWYEQLETLLDPNTGFIPPPAPPLPSVLDELARPAQTTVPAVPSKAIAVGE